jgi:E3 ubiquitin-protein ligase SIAH1
MILTSSIAELMEQLQCPLCKDRVTVPITFCEKGHNVCCTCRESLDDCTTCSQQFSGIRNINLEKISFWSNFCRHLARGCRVMVPVELMADHLAICIYKKATCPLNKTMSIVCPWEGPLKDVEFHCKESHRNRFAECKFFMSSST